MILSLVVFAMGCVRFRGFISFIFQFYYPLLSCPRRKVCYNLTVGLRGKSPLLIDLVNSTNSRFSCLTFSSNSETRDATLLQSALAHSSISFHCCFSVKSSCPP